MSLLLKWHLAIPDSKRHGYGRLLGCIDNAEVLGNDMLAKWSLEMRGYFADIQSQDSGAHARIDMCAALAGFGACARQKRSGTVRRYWQR
jgi:hypothetical protein